MPTYIMLMKFTQKAVDTIQESPQRVQRARDIFKSLGGDLKVLYYTFGRYDMVSVVEAPSDEAMGKAFLMIGRFRTVSIETLKAFPETECYEIIKGIS